MEEHQTMSQIRQVFLILVSGCLFVGCARESQKPSPVGFPVRVGVQGNEPLPVKLNSDANNSIFIEFSPSNAALPVKLQSGPNDRLPVALVLENGEVLPIKIKAEVNSPLAVELQNKFLTVELNIKEPLPVAIYIPSKILIFAGAAIAVILAVCIAMNLSHRHK